MPSPLRRSLIAFLLESPLLANYAHAQAATPESRLDVARGEYYTPTAAGLKSFHCNVSVDWKDMLVRFGRKDLTDTDPSLLYLKAVKLSLDDDLHGAGELHWTDTTPPPAGTEESTSKIKGGMVQMVSGFFQSWNPFMNGTIIPVLDASSTATPEGEGLHIHGGDGSTVVDEHFDKNMLFTEMHVVSPALDVTAHPTYINTPHGRIISVLKSELHQPPTAPALEVIMEATYTTVSSFQLPANLTFTIENVGAFHFTLAGCEVNSVGKSAMGE